ncbi:MAG: putative metalloprotease CJM1_0395 family protein [Planctomycetota bacterium]
MSALASALQAFDTSGLSARARQAYPLRGATASPEARPGSPLAGSRGGGRVGEAARANSPSRSADTVSISAEARSAAAAGVNKKEGAEAGRGATAESAPSGGATGTDGQPLSEAEQKQVEELKARDQEVRRHEQAHKSAAGQYATSGPTYTYQTGPDGKRYAVGGEVGIDVSPERTPEETIQKMEVVRRAALAPAEPSAQDRKVAAQAQRTAQEARQELQQQRAEERSDQTENDGGTGEFGVANVEPADLTERASTNGDDREPVTELPGRSSDSTGTAETGDLSRADSAGGTGSANGANSGGSSGATSGGGQATETLGGDTGFTGSAVGTTSDATGAIASALISQLSLLAEPTRTIDVVA